MAKVHELKPMTAALGASFAVSLAAVPALHAAENPFSITQFESGYAVAAGGAEVPEWAQLNDTVHTYGATAAEGKCGASKVKAVVKDMAEGKCGAGEVKAAVKSVTEGKCGEGKCGANK